MVQKTKRIELLIKQLIEIVEKAKLQSENIRAEMKRSDKSRLDDRVVNLDQKTGYLTTREQNIFEIEKWLNNLKYALNDMNQLNHLSVSAIEFQHYNTLLLKLGMGREDLSANKNERSPNILFTFGKDPSKQYYGNLDTTSENQNITEKLTTMLVFTARAILRMVDFIRHSLIFMDNIDKPKHEKTKIYNDNGETPFAQVLTGRTQFFPKPVLSFRDAKNEMEKISDLLNEEIKPKDRYSRY